MWLVPALRFPEFTEEWKRIKVSDLLEKDALIIVEASLATDFSYLEELGFLMIKQKKYKTNMHVFISVEE